MIDTLLTPRLVLTCLRQEDAAALRDYEWRNRASFAPHGPLRSDEDFLPDAFAARVASMLRDVDSGASSRWVVRLRDTPATIIGHVAITGIQRGVRQAGFLGYGVDDLHAGKGIATEGVAALIAHAFGALNLHRLEACHRAENVASARVLAKLGFVREGLAHAYLCLNGVWEDQVLNGLCNPDWQPTTEPDTGRAPQQAAPHTEEHKK